MHYKDKKNSVANKCEIDHLKIKDYYIKPLFAY